MPLCTKCGFEADAGFKFCPKCGSELDAATPSREQRKTVTVLFCDVTGSTALGESTDPEALRALLSRYFERMKGIVEAHGGTVEKFIGDAVMAVFGVPIVYEDDALRAVRAAVEMRAALPELGLEARIGLNTGEVVTGTEERLATGDPVNVAARLEQAATPGEVLIGHETLRLVRDSIEAEPVEPLALKGKTERVPAWRLLSVTGEEARAHAAPMVGRETELRRLRDAYEQAVRSRSCQLFTVLGSAGVGKSRLAAEFIRGLVDAHVVQGRCLSYGEGITYWPVVEVVKQLDALPSDESAAVAMRSLLGESEAASSADEIAWAFRKLLEEQAENRPLVVVFDDVHWGEQTFLDLVEHISDLSRDASLLLLCMARPELLDRRPGWGGGKMNATTVLLEPLDAAETDSLLAALGGVDDRLRDRIREASEGNPLFVEEMLALVRDSGGAEVEVPPTIQALLAARLDQLDPAERNVLERGSVEGRVFHQGAVQALSNGEPQVSQNLLALVRKELVRPDKSQLPGDDAFRFRHLLIRDAAYDALPKATRAELHERFAAWLAESGSDLVELDEILGHHLEQAVLYKRELGQEDAALAARAGELLGDAGLRAAWRTDYVAAIALLERALGLVRPLRLDVKLELALAGAHSNRFDQNRAAEIAEAAAERAQRAGDVVGEAAARVVAEHNRCLVAVDPRFDDLDALAQAALPLLEGANEHAGLVHVWVAIADLANLRARGDERTHAIEQALRQARLAGSRPNHLFGLDGALVSGPRPADEALATLDAVTSDTPTPGTELNRARLLAMLGRFEEAWPLANSASERIREFTGDNRGELVLADIAAYEGDYETAAHYLRRRCAVFEERELWPYLATYAPALGRCLCQLGRFDEVEPLAQRGRELGNEQDVDAQRLWRQVQARVLAHRGRYEEAERLAREAVAILDQTDALSIQGDTRWDLAEVLAASGRREEAADAYEQAIERYARKKNLAMVAQARPRLEALREELSA
ncbi:MAG: AAA family ATPase [Actinobacteria bacterium]|nr:AAA family ATPase [Actinomycetota bacterium]